MLPHVRLEIVFQVEPAATNIAHKCSFLSVCFNVPLQLGPRFKGKVTACTLKLK